MKKQKIKEWLHKHDFILFFSIIGSIITVISIFLAQHILLIASTLLTLFINVNVAIIGFWGLILVYLLTSLHTSKERAETERHEINIKLNELAYDQLKTTILGEGVRHGAPVIFRKMQETYQARDEQLSDNIRTLKKLSKTACMVGAMITLIFLGSILFSIWGVSLSSTSDIPNLFWASYFALTTFLIGIVVMFFAIWLFLSKI